MSDVNCPMCGKPNPPDAEMCAFCQARLKPLQPPAENEGEDTDREDLFPAVEPGESLTSPEGYSGISPVYGAEGGASEEDPAKAHRSEEHGDLPEWLDRISMEEPGGLPEESDASSTASWLEEMRPSYDPTPTRPARHSSDRVEKGGPLAGLRGVLAAEPNAVRAGKPLDLPSQLTVSANQRAHADLLKSLFEDAGERRPAPGQHPIFSRFYLRWGILLVLLVVLLWPAMTGSQDTPLPLYLEESAELNRLVGQLPADAKVLVAFDYYPGLSAEVETAAAAVVDHLMQRGAYLTLISTLPSGPVLAERFIQVTMGEHRYIGGIQYVNLGYIPGGPVGLLNFVESPQRSLPYSLNGIAAWETAGHGALPPLQGVGAVEDFSMILVLVDDPDTARAWVEQLQTRLGGSLSLTSLVMVTSAQVEPVILPYYVGVPRQVHGLVAGLRGGAAYARLTGSSTEPRRYWDAYGAGMFLGAILILAGGLIFAVLPWLTRPPEVGREVRG